MSEQIILASSSPFRRNLLDRLQLPYSCLSPDIDEQPLIEEAAADTALRLAIGKAQAVASLYKDAIVIGSDQVAELNGVQLGKPGALENARTQLRQQSGQRVHFHTGLALARNEQLWTALNTTTVHFRELSAREIDLYLEKEQPLQCAGSFMAESLGITLFESIESSDPSALIGLPLIQLCAGLRQFGVDI